MNDKKDLQQHSRDKIVFHIDVNSAFLSWTAAYRVNVLGEKEDLRNIPAVIGGSEKSRHGIVLAKSTPAKVYGIQTGEPLVKARQKCPNLVVVPPDYALYVKCSKAFIDLLHQYTPEVEQYSIDESWCIFEGMHQIYGSPQTLAYQLKDQIQRELGFTVNIGISTNKLLSKMASDFQKPNRVHTLFPEEIADKMWPLPVSELFFVGRATTVKLNKLGIYTIGDLARANPEILKSHLKSHGEIIYAYANGGDLKDYVSHDQPNKGYGNSITVPEDIIDSKEAKHVLLSLCETIGMRLRNDHVFIQCVTVSIVDKEFEHVTKQISLQTATDITEEIYVYVCQTFDEVWTGQPIRQLGVHTFRVTPASDRQYNFFDMQKYDRLQKLDEAIDSIRKTYGEDSVFRASYLDSKIPHMTGGLDKNKRSGMTSAIDDDARRVFENNE